MSLIKACKSAIRTIFFLNCQHWQYWHNCHFCVQFRNNCLLCVCVCVCECLCVILVGFQYEIINEDTKHFIISIAWMIVIYDKEKSLLSILCCYLFTKTSISLSRCFDACMITGKQHRIYKTAKSLDPLRPLRNIKLRINVRLDKLQLMYLKLMCSFCVFVGV